MSFRNIVTSFFVSIGLILSSGSVFAESEPSSKFRVLSDDFKLKTVRLILVITNNTANKRESDPKVSLSFKNINYAKAINSILFAKLSAFAVERDALIPENFPGPILTNTLVKFFIFKS